jgi:hypothetical protein
MSITDTPDLQIIGAAYGLAKVTGKVISLVNRSTTPQSLSVPATNATFGDSWPGKRKCLTVAYRYGDGGAVRVAAVKEGETLAIGAAEFKAATAAAVTTDPVLTVFAATYGPKDVTTAVQSHISPSQTLSVTADNATFGDSWFGVTKTLVVVAAYTNQVPYVDIVQEHEVYSLHYRPPLRIISAKWGLADVAATVQAAVRRRALTIPANDTALGDGWPGVRKSLAVVYQYADEQPQLAIATEGDILSVDYAASTAYQPPADPRALNVIRAAYGKADVTPKVASQVSANELHFVANNALLGDGWPSVRKSFAMTYSWGPSVPASLVVSEGSTVDLSRASLSWRSGLVTMAGLFADGDEVAFKASNDAYWVAAPGGIITASADTRQAATSFVVHPVAGSAELTLEASGAGYVVVGPDGTLRAGGALLAAAKIVPALTTSGEIVLSIVGPGPAFSTLAADGSIVAAGSDARTFATTFSIAMSPTAAGLASHTAAFADGADVEISLELAKVIWDLTGGWFTALGLGPLLLGSNRVSTGVVAIFRQNARISAALDALVAAVRANPEVSLTAAFVTFEVLLWNEGVGWKILRFLLKLGGWWTVAFGLTKVLEWTLLPEAEAAELVVSFAFWGYTTTTDIIALVNSADHTALLAA